MTGAPPIISSSSCEFILLAIVRVWSEVWAAAGGWGLLACGSTT